MPVRQSNDASESAHAPLNPFAEVQHKGLSERYRVDPFHPAGGLLHIKGSIVFSTIPQLLFFTATAATVCVVNNYAPTRGVLQLPTTLISVLGTVLGFIVSYRTSSAYERYSEGRRLWTAVILESRTWSRVIWHHIPTAKDATEEMRVKLLIERKTMINIGSAFAVALKHYLRGEPGVGYKDLYPLVAFLPRYHLPSSTHIDRPDLPTAVSSSTIPRYHLPTLTRVDEASFMSGSTLNGPQHGTHRLSPQHPLLPSYNPPPHQAKDFMPFYAIFADLIGMWTKRAPDHTNMPDSKTKRRLVRGGGGKGVSGNLPLEITLIMGAYVSALTGREPYNTTCMNQMMKSVYAFSECLAGLERILYTPLPISYGLHLQHTIWLYLLLLPTQIYATFGWATIPAVTIIAFVYLGFLEIGKVIENPFGYDHNDLDLDSFCHIIQNEANEVTAHNPIELNPASYCFSDNNLPLSFYPEWKGRSAKEMIDEGISLDELHDTLRRAGGKVKSNAATRKAARDVIIDLAT